jgi:acetate kinase
VSPGARSTRRRSRSVLVLNAGSRTIKASVVDASHRTLASGEADRPESARPADDRAIVQDLLGPLLEQTEAHDPGGPVAVGHRVVHGGPTFRAPAVVDDAVLERIDAVSDLAPLHNPVAVAVIRAARSALPDVPHVACFDTAFHATLPEVAWRYPVPEAWLDDWGVRRYGFHGLSVEWSVGRAAEVLGRPVRALDLVVAHLGGGCSVTAVRAGRSVWTSMGLTPLEGLMMTTRSGSIDPGVILHALARGASAHEVGTTLDVGAGLLAVAGTGDVRAVRASATRGDLHSRLGLAMFIDRAAAELAGAATRLRRIDAIVFTGGIGENAAGIRSAIVARLAPLRDGRAAPPTLVVRAREDLVIAAAAFRVVRARRS